MILNFIPGSLLNIQHQVASIPAARNRPPTSGGLVKATVAPVFHKKERRIEAVLLLHFLALMIVSLIEINIRLNMTKHKIEKLPILPLGAQEFGKLMGMPIKL